MEIATKTNGTITIEENQIYEVPSGLFGFEEYTSFAMYEAEQKPFLWFQSLQDKNLSFLLIDPFAFCSDYELDIDDESLKSIGIESPSDVIVMSIVTVPCDGSPITANLQGPLIFNKKNNKCIQVISCDPRWFTKHDIFAEAAKRGGSC
ncbi:MAG: flagellar assembly protein FliW [Spirochaetaceae bacterium]|nr:flagellar assembly protein FliW [Spirochaetaceae bacterium]MBR3814230.1 flagellar assembly protein FliW [Spirochaetaceae bacterium]MBR6214987.1 flagellar assembly protein FliW [Spirochaetaceae bacterium]MDD6486498.1 flagellar assembly protein FliW [Spirochaetales bacterium]